MRLLTPCIAVLFVLITAAQAISADSDTCYADGDINHNSIAFEVGDFVLLENFILGISPLAGPLYEGDLNVDGFVDAADAGFLWQIITGNVAPPETPFMTTCYPDTVRGACFCNDTCLVLSSSNCGDSGGTYLGDGELFCYCWADGDVNHNGVSFEIADWILLENFIRGISSLPGPPYEGDLNADGFVDAADAGFLWLIITGDAAPPETPFPTTCYPDTVRGACFCNDTCLVLSSSNCGDSGGTYLGDGELFCYCWADGDIDGDGTALSVLDMVYLTRFLYFGGPLPDPLYRADLNADGYIDGADYILLDSLMTYEAGTFPPWYTPTECYPDTVRGGCVDGDSCVVRSPANCAACGGTYLGDGVGCACDCTDLGDMDLDGLITPVDVVILVNFIYRGWNTRELIIQCGVENGDWDCSRTINPTDLQFCVKYVYMMQGTGPCDPCPSP